MTRHGASARPAIIALLIGSLMLLVTACETAQGLPPASTLPVTPTEVVVAAPSHTAAPAEPSATVESVEGPPATAESIPRDPDWPAIFGVEVSRNTGEAMAEPAAGAGVSWVRYNGVLWHEVEAVEGERDWATQQRLERDLQALAERGLSTVLITRGTPAWAQKVPGSLCGPIREESLDDFASFMGELVARYSQPPYNVKYWEMGNEPDVDPALLDPTMPFGCWGDQEDPYYGGGYYAEMLKAVYPAIKAADPEAQVLIGGLLLDCDPDAPPEGTDCKPSRFLEGIVENGGAGVFDIVAYHAYSYWTPGYPDPDIIETKWDQRGGALLGKLDFIRDTMARYGVEKPVLMNEGGVLCFPSNPQCPGESFHEAQASYVPRLYARSWAAGLMGALWYTLDGPGWREGGLLTAERAPRPAYRALTFMTGLLEGAAFDKVLSRDPVEGYQFRRDNTLYQIVWTNELETTASYPVPDGTLAIYNHLGEEQPLEDTVELSHEPVFLQVEP